MGTGCNRSTWLWVDVVIVARKKTHRTLDACRFKTINSINKIFCTCFAQSVLSNYKKFHNSNPTSSYDNVQDVP